MKILIACEFSGIVRDAFAALGHNAWSCDLLPSERPGKHIIGDVLPHINDGWDMIIAHPPCTYLCNSGVRWLKGNTERQRLRDDSIEFVKSLWEAPVEKMVIENPIGCLSTQWMKPTQIIQPWMFGHGETKATCLWIRGLEPLLATEVVDGRAPKIHWMAPGVNRWKERSRTYAGIAKAMADQWRKL